jgi:hypothetical protein
MAHSETGQGGELFKERTWLYARSVGAMRMIERGVNLTSLNTSIISTFSKRGKTARVPKKNRR